MDNSLQLSEADTKYWAPIPPVLEWVTSRVADGARVLEVGPGHMPFPLADTFVGWLVDDDAKADNVVQCDIQEDTLPFDDDAFDFVYCRHVLEDIYNPFHLCREMSRVAKAGYLETPSPIAEMCRGIDATSPAWRGYIHHRYFAWNDGGTLRFLSKYPAVEFIGNEDFERQIVELLRAHNLYWNTYFHWEGEIPFTYYQHETDYNITENYGDLIIQAIEQSHAATNAFGEELNAFLDAGPAPGA